jgi:hypothetical protein
MMAKVISRGGAEARRNKNENHALNPKSEVETTKYTKDTKMECQP